MAVTLGPGPTMFSFESPLAPARGGDQAAAPLLDDAPSPWEIGPTVMRFSVRAPSPANKAGMHRAAGFTRRFQRAAGLLADERHERWETHQLPGTLRIESICRPEAIAPFAQPPLATGPAKGGQAGEQQIHSVNASRQQKRTAGAAIAMAAGKDQPRKNEFRRVPDLPHLQPMRVKLRTSERAARRAEQMRGLFEEDIGAAGAERSACTAADASHDAAGRENDAHAITSSASSAANVPGHASGRSRPTSTASPTALAARTGGRKSKHEQYALWGWSRVTTPAPSKSDHGLRSPIASPTSALFSYIPQSTALFPGHPCATSPGKLNGRSAVVANTSQRLQASPRASSSQAALQHSIPHLRDQRLLRIVTDDERVSPASHGAKATHTAASTRPTTMSSFHDEPLYDGDQSLGDDSLMFSSSTRSNAGANPRLWHHTFSSRKKKRGAGPVLKTAMERKDLLSRSASDLQINLEEEVGALLLTYFMPVRCFMRILNPSHVCVFSVVFCGWVRSAVIRARVVLNLLCVTAGPMDAQTGTPCRAQRSTRLDALSTLHRAQTARRQPRVFSIGAAKRDRTAHGNETADLR